eukprot:m.203836 g.203836  ORF g.203836 m.203836 type:complete len:51 (-) comp16879_c8_seq2:52-204(-)
MYTIATALNHLTFIFEICTNKFLMILLLAEQQHCAGFFPSYTRNSHFMQW